MSRTYDGYQGLALILTKAQYMSLWNKTHPDEMIEDAYDLFDLNDQIVDYSDANCCTFNIDTTKDYGSAIRDEEKSGELNIFKQSVWAMFAPKGQNYFKATYENLEELMTDIAQQSCLFEVGEDGLSNDDMAFVRDHVAYLYVVTFG